MSRTLSGKGGTLSVDGWPQMPIGSWSMEEKPEQRCRTQIELDLLYGVKVVDGNLGLQIKMVEDDRTPVEKQRDLWESVRHRRTLVFMVARDVGLDRATCRAAGRGSLRALAAIDRRLKVLL